MLYEVEFEVISASVHKARKPFKCRYCGKTIHKGEIYERKFYKLEGKVGTSRSHYHENPGSEPCPIQVGNEGI